MNIIGSKGATPFAIKAIIIMMSLLYVLGPINVEMKGFFHTIVHSLEMPDTILSHQKKSDGTNIHHSTEHKNAITHHDHGVLDLVQKILKGADSRSESPDHLRTKHKIDKHISLRKNPDKEKGLFLFSEVMHSFFDIDSKLCRGYANGYSEPPEVCNGIFI